MPDSSVEPPASGTMRAVVLSAPRQARVETVRMPSFGPRDVLTRPLAVGICGTDFHIYEGEANYQCDRDGHPIPLQRAPLVLGHEIFAEVVEKGREVGDDLRVGDHVVVDQGWNCQSQGRHPVCTFCASGDSHQCEFYLEQGLAGLPGGLAEFLQVPAVNALRAERHLDPCVGALSEPLGCVLHASATVKRAVQARYRFAGVSPIRTVLICGAGPAGLLFVQYLRQVERFDGQILVADPVADKRALAVKFGATALDPAAAPLTEQVREKTGGAGVEYLIDAAGNGPLFAEMPGLIRKQATILLYGHGHANANLSLLNALQFKEVCFVAAVGASGGFDANGRPSIYRQALELLASRTVCVEDLLSHRFRGLQAGLDVFARDRYAPNYIKGVVLPQEAPAPT